MYVRAVTLSLSLCLFLASVFKVVFSHFTACIAHRLLNITIQRPLLDYVEKTNFISATCIRCMTRLSHEHDVCLSVCLSVTLVDCDHIHSATQSGNYYYYAVFDAPCVGQLKRRNRRSNEIAAHDRTGHDSYMHAEADPNHGILSVIPNCAEKDEWGMGKCGVLQSGGNNLRNGASYALDHY